MGIIVQKCLYDYDCSKCRGKQTNCVAYAQKKWKDVSVLNQKYLSELEGYKATGLNQSEVAILAQAKADGRLEIITKEQKQSKDRLLNYSADDNFFDDEYS